MFLSVIRLMFSLHLFEVRVKRIVCTVCLFFPPPPPKTIPKNTKDFFFFKCSNFTGKDKVCPELIVFVIKLTSL